MNLRTSLHGRLGLVVFASVVAATGLDGCASKPKPALATQSPPPPTPPPPPYSPPPASGAIATGPLAGSVQDFVLKAGDRIYFAFDQYSISPDGARILSAQADWLQRYPGVKVRIEGNADERGTEVYNFALGARRADAVKTFLIEHQIDPSRITTISYGKEHPIDPGSNEEAWAHNRNAHTAITQGAR